MDAVSYESDTGAPYTEGLGAPADHGWPTDMGLSRSPDGSDMDDNSADFVLLANTPGASNDGTPIIPVAGPMAVLLISAALASSGMRLLRRG